MVAAPQSGALILKGETGKIYSVDFYASDVAGGLINFDSGAGSGSASQTFWTPPENVILTDLFIHTGMTDTIRVRVTKGGQPTPSILHFAAHLDTSQGRPLLTEGFRAGVQIGMIQLA